MNKELEEAISICNAIKKNIKCDSTFDLNILKLNRNNELALETALKHIENSISKEVIEEKIEKYKQQLKNNTKRIVQLQVLEQNDVLQQSEWEELNALFGDVEKIRGKLEVLQELLEGK